MISSLSIPGDKYSLRYFQRKHAVMKLVKSFGSWAAFASLIFRGVLRSLSQLTTGISVSHLQAAWRAVPCVQDLSLQTVKNSRHYLNKEDLVLFLILACGLLGNSNLFTGTIAVHREDVSVCFISNCGHEGQCASMSLYCSHPLPTHSSRLGSRSYQGTTGIL